MLPLFVTFAPQPFPSLYSDPRCTVFVPLLCFHEFANRSSHLIDLESLCFHALVSCFFRKPFIFTFIQIAGGVTPLLKEFLCALGVSTANAFFSVDCGLFCSLASLFRGPSVCFQQLAASFAKLPGVGWPCPARSQNFPLHVS